MEFNISPNPKPNKDIGHLKQVISLLSVIATILKKLDCCRNLHKSCLHNPCPQRWGSDSVFLYKPAVAPYCLAARFRFFVQAGCRYLLPGGPIPFFWTSRLSLPNCLAVLLTKVGDVESNPGPTTHTDKREQTSIRCNNTHWGHLNCTHIKQRQYKPDWRSTFHTLTLNVTTPSTDNTTSHHKQTTTHPLTNNNQPKDKKHRHTSNQHKRHQKQNRGTHTEKPNT